MAVDPFVPEAWTWLAVTMSVVVARYVCRFQQVKSIRRMGIEDLVMFLVALLYIAEINFLVKLEFTPTNLIAPDAIFNPNDPAEVALRIYGSKLIVAEETTFCALIWGTKACLLLYYAKMTYALPGSFRYTQLIAAYVAVGYVVMEILYFAVWCRPFYNYWSVPVAEMQCATAENHLILNFVLNVSSDLMIMAIPLPLLLRSKLPLRKKFVLIAAFSLGLFVIASAVMNRAYSFTHLNGTGWVFWFVREASMAVIVANIPYLWALIRRTFRLKSFVGNIPVGSDFSSVPSRFYSEVDDPLSPRRRPRKNTDGSIPSSIDTYDIDRVLADVEREAGLAAQPPYMREIGESRKSPSLLGHHELQLPTVPDPIHLPRISESSSRPSSMSSK